MRTICGVLGVVLLAGSAGATDYYVSPGGSDGYAGTLAQPFHTIQQAANVAQPGDNVYICGGTYREDVVMPNSGTAAAPITFQPYAGQHVTITGLDAVTGSWNDYSGPIYSLSTTAAAGTSQVFVNGAMVGQARWPNPVYNNPLVAAQASVDSASVNTGAQTATVTDTALGSPAAGAWNGAKIAIRSGDSTTQYTAWNATVASQSGNSLTYAWSRNDAYNPQSGNHYYLYGSLAAMSSGNQWYANASTGTLYLQTANGAAPTGQTVEARTRLNGFDLNGKSYVNLSGLQFNAANVQVSGNHDLVNNCQILYAAPFSDPNANTAISGVTVTGQYNTIQNSEIAYSYGDGVTLAGPNNTINNNVIHDVGWAGADSAFVNMWTYQLGTNTAGSSNNTVTNNTLYNGSREGVRVSGYGGVATNNITIAHNDVSRFGYLSHDVGGVALDNQSTSSAGNVVAYNSIHDSTSTGINVGLYTDNGSSGDLLHHNLVYNVQRGAITNPPTTNVDLYNNTFWNVSYTMTGSSGTNSHTYNNFSNSNSYNFVGTTKTNYRSNTSPFVNAAAGDFTLASTATNLIDKGTVIPGVTDGYSGAAPDIGAFEYGQAAWTAGASFKTWLFADQVSAPLAAAVSVQQTGGVPVATGSLMVGNTAGTGSNSRALLKFDLTGLNTAPIEKAVLRVCEDANGVNPDGGSLINAGSVALDRVLSPWTAGGATYGQAAGTLLSSSFYNPANLELFTDIDVTATVADWLANPAANYGFSLLGTENASNTAKYFSGWSDVSGPQLIITYAAVPEPGPLALLASAALAGLGILKLSRRQKNKSLLVTRSVS